MEMKKCVIPKDSKFRRKFTRQSTIPCNMKCDVQMPVLLTFSAFYDSVSKIEAGIFLFWNGIQAGRNVKNGIQ